MTLSMTGFGKAEGTYQDRQFTVMVKTVNHRYLDIGIRLPSLFSFGELEIRKIVSQFFLRGKVDVFIKLENNDREGQARGQLTLNAPQLENCYELILGMKRHLHLPQEVGLAELLIFKDLFISQETLSPPEEFPPVLRETLTEALKGAWQMRKTEGEALADAMREILDRTEILLQEVKRRRPLALEEYRKRLEERLRTLAAGMVLEETRLIQEIALWAEKSDVTEEMERLASHIAQFRELMDQGESEGRKLDFLVQEMARESNTLGAKGADGEMARLAIEVKSEIARLKEQVQNIE
jgi:uncharacterized protein (TIGR00255 family)